MSSQRIAGSSSRSRKRVSRKPRSSIMIAQEIKQTNQLVDIRRILSQGTQTPQVPDVLPVMLRRDKVYTIQRSVALTSFSSNNAGEAPFSMNFSLDQLPGYTDFTAAFDQYKIAQVHLRFTPRPYVGTAPNFGYTPDYILTAIDYDDSTAVSSAMLLQFQTLLISATDKPFERTLVPRVAESVYTGAAFSGYANTTTWLDVASPDVRHYGLKGVLPQYGTAQLTTLLDVVATYTINLKNPR